MAETGSSPLTTFLCLDRSRGIEIFGAERIEALRFGQWLSFLGDEFMVLLGVEGEEGPGLSARDDRLVLMRTDESRSQAAALQERLLGQKPVTEGDLEVMEEAPVHTPESFGPDDQWLQEYLDGNRGVAVNPIRNERGGWGGHHGQCRVILLETGWAQGHLDLPVPLKTFTWSSNGSKSGGAKAQRKHGNAMLGVLSGRRDNKGVVGLVPDAEVILGLHRQEPGARSLTSSGLLPLIRKAINDFARQGDVLVIPMDAVKFRLRGSWQHTNRLGLEAWYASRALFDRAARKGVYVVCAAGNGLGCKLECFCSQGHSPSPAMVVGASSSTADARLPTSNHSRIQFHSWGDNVATCTENGYTAHFNGTSSATAIVAGVVALLASHVKAEKNQFLTPVQMRRLLTFTGTRSISGIGVQPNVANALQRLQQIDYDLDKL